MIHGFFECLLHPSQDPTPSNLQHPTLHAEPTGQVISFDQRMQLLSLPPEIRNRIWTLVVLVDGKIRVRRRPERGCKPSRTRSVPL